MIIGGYESYIFDVLTFTATLDNPQNPNLLINEVLTLIHPVASQATVIAALKNILLSGQTTDIYWTSAWNNYMANTSNTVNKDIVKSRLQAFYKAVLKMVEYHLC